MDWNRWAQALSDQAAADPSSYFWLEPGVTRTLDLLFSHTYIPAGKFSLKRDGKDSPNWRLYLNCAGNDYYQRGIPGVAGSIDATAAWLARVIAGLDVSFVRTIGVSMGGYAALLFGRLLSADRVIAVGPEIAIGAPHDRSFIWSEAKIYDPRHRDLTAILQSLGARAQIAFGAYEIADFPHIRRVEAAGGEIAFLHSFHSGGQWLDWPKILAAERDLAFPRDFTAHPLFDFAYGLEALDLSEAAFAAICARDFAQAQKSLMALSAVLPNPGVVAQAAAQGALIEDGASARMWRDKAKAAHLEAYRDSGIEAPDAFPSRLVMGAYRHILRADEQERLRDLFDRSERPVL